MQLIKIYVASLLVFGILDLIWLGWLGKGIYDKYLEPIKAESPDKLAAGMFYLMFIGGLMYFSTMPALEFEQSSQVLMRGAIFGFVVYATYDLTNRAVLTHWPWPIVAIDILWGIVLCASITWVGWKVGKM